MNKLVKGSIAGAAGIALLLGGAGTLAYWNADVVIGDGATITAGHLTIDSDGDGQWKDKAGVDIDTADLVAMKIVPGDKFTYSETFEVDAEGDNLLFDITDNFATTFTTTAGGGVAVTSSYDVNGGAVTTGLTEGTYTVEFTATVDFPPTPGTGNQVDYDKVIDFSAAKIIVAQQL